MMMMVIDCCQVIVLIIVKVVVTIVVITIVVHEELLARNGLHQWLAITTHSKGMMDNVIIGLERYYRCCCQAFSLVSLLYCEIYSTVYW
jgi:hypothetical protein